MYINDWDLWQRLLEARHGERRIETRYNYMAKEEPFDMTAEQFVYWLQGFMEVANPGTISESETQVIKDHLKLVFDKQTPDRYPSVSIPFVQPAGPMYEPGKPYWEIDPNRVYCSPTELTTFTTNTPICDMTDSNTPIAGSLDTPTKKPSRREKFPNIKC